MHSVLMVSVERQEYGCVLCQAWHSEGEPVYAEHLMLQSKHGLRRRIDTRFWSLVQGLKLHGFLPFMIPVEITREQAAELLGERVDRLPRSTQWS